MAEEIGSLAVSLSLESADFSRSMASVDRSLKTLGQEMRINQNHGKAWGNSLTGLSTKQDGLTRMLSAQDVKVRQLNEAYQKSKEETGETSKATENLATRLNKATAEYTRTETELAQVTASLKKQQDELRLNENGWTRFGEKLHSVGAPMKKLGENMTRIGKDLSMKITAPLVALGGLATKASIDFESAFAGVRKTISMSEAEFDKLSDSIRDMSKEIPAAATEIAGVAEAAGQLGIQNDAILGFTRTMVDMGVATDMASDDAAMALARLATITQMNQQDFDKLGSTVVGLGNNLAATESEIVEMGLRLAGAGSVIGMTEAQVLGFSGALAAVGVNAEAGGSAFSKLFIEAANLAATGGEGLTQFAEVAGMSSKEFQKAFKEDATGAIIDFIEGLGKINEAGGNVFGVLDDLGLSEIRLRDALLRTSGASDTLRNAVDLGTKSWEENNALTNEAAERYETTASQLQIFKNKLTDLGITIGDILVPVLISVMDAIEPWIEKFASLGEETQKTMLVIGGIAAAIAPLLVIGGTLISSLTAIFTAFGTVSMAIGAVTTGVASTVPAVSALAGAFTVLTGPIGLTIAAIGAVVAAAATLYVKWDDIEEKFGTVGQAIGTFAVGPLGVVVAGIKTFQDAVSDAIDPVDRFGNEVSESTKDALGSFFELSDGVSQSMAQLSMTNSVVTEDMKNDIVGKYAEMNTQILEGMKTRHDEEYSQLQSMLLNTSALTDEEKEAILTKKQEQYDTEVERLQWKEDKINEILQQAADENRQTTERENEVIRNINKQAQEQAVQVLTESEMEQKIILERMKDSAADLSAQQAAEVVKNSAEQREKTVAEAEAQFDEVYAAVLRMRDETGELTEEQADKIIREARKQKDESVKLAQDMHSEVVEQAQQQANEHINLVDWETGEILTKWEVFKNNATQKFEEIKQMLFDKFVEMVANTVAKGSEIVTAAQDKFEETKTAIKTKLEEAVVEVATQIGKMPGKVREKVSDMVTAGGELIDGVIRGITGKVGEGLTAIGDFAKSLVARFKKDTETKSPSRAFEKVAVWFAPGVAQGVKKTEGVAISAVSTMAKNMTSATDKILTEGAKKVNNETAKINEAARKEATKLEKRAQEDINLIHAKAKKAKRKLTSAEVVRIQRIEEDTAKKVENIHEKAAKDIKKIEEKLAKDVEDARRKEFENSKAWINKKKQYNELSLTDELAAWERVQARYQEGTKEREEADLRVYETKKAIQSEINKINEEHLKKTQEINQKLIDDEKRLNEEYKKAVDDRAKSLQNFVGIFNEFNWESEITGDGLLSNLQDQVDGFKVWQNELGKLTTKGVSENLLAELRELGPNALPELIALNQLTEEQLEDYVGLYEEKTRLAREQSEMELFGMKLDTEKEINNLRKVANDELGKLQKDWTKNIESITKATSDEFKSLTSIGKQAGQNLLDGLASMESSLIDKARQIATSVNSALQSTLGGSVDVPNIVGVSGYNIGGRAYAGSGDTTYGDSNINLNGPIYMRNDNDVKMLARELDALQKSKQRGLGTR